MVISLYKCFKTLNYVVSTVYFPSLFDGPNIQSTWHFCSPTALQLCQNNSLHPQKMLRTTQNTRHVRFTSCTWHDSEFESFPYPQPNCVRVCLEPDWALLAQMLSDPSLVSVLPSHAPWWTDLIGKHARVQVTWNKWWICEGTVRSCNWKNVWKTMCLSSMSLYRDVDRSTE